MVQNWSLYVTSSSVTSQQNWRGYTCVDFTLNYHVVKLCGGLKLPCNCVVGWNLYVTLFRWLFLSYITLVASTHNLTRNNTLLCFAMIIENLISILESESEIAIKIITWFNLNLSTPAPTPTPPPPFLLVIP